MKRLWIGIIVLAVLLILGGAVSWAMDAIHISMAENLQQAAEAAMAEDWGAALQCAEKARESWKDHQHFVAAFADHTPMDELEGLFAELEIYAQAREQAHFAATCAHLAQLAQAMAESHSPTWWNFL